MCKTATVHVKDAIVILEKSVPSDFYIMHVIWQTPPHTCTASCSTGTRVKCTCWLWSQLLTSIHSQCSECIYLCIHSHEHLHMLVLKLSKDISLPTYYILWTDSKVLPKPLQPLHLFKRMNYWIQHSFIWMVKSCGRKTVSWICILTTS
jgi:hypothetical protein